MSELHERLAAAAGDRTYRHLADLTGQNAETVRRYMQGQAPSVEFLSKLAHSLQLNGSWLLTGQGPMRAGDVKGHALREAHAAELLHAMANTLTQLIARVERLEVFVQTMEARLRASRPAEAGSVGAASVGSGRDERGEGEGRASGPAVQVPGVAGRIAAAAAQRPRPAAD